MVYIYYTSIHLYSWVCKMIPHENKTRVSLYSQFHYYGLSVSTIFQQHKAIYLSSYTTWLRIKVRYIRMPYIMCNSTFPLYRIRQGEYNLNMRWALLSTDLTSDIIRRYTNYYSMHTVIYRMFPLKLFKGTHCDFSPML